MGVTVRSTRRESLPYSGFVMDGGKDSSRPKIDVGALEVRRRYRIDWKNEQLRRSFRSTGTLLSIEESPATTPGGQPERWLAFEVKPRFGAATIQRIDVATLLSIEPA
jgi:hypothetical protein